MKGGKKYNLMDDKYFMEDFDLIVEPEYEDIEYSQIVNELEIYSHSKECHWKN